MRFLPDFQSIRGRLPSWLDRTSPKSRVSPSNSSPISSKSKPKYKPKSNAPTTPSNVPPEWQVRDFEREMTMRFGLDEMQLQFEDLRTRTYTGIGVASPTTIPVEFERHRATRQWLRTQASDTTLQPLTHRRRRRRSGEFPSDVHHNNNESEDSDSEDDLALESRPPTPGSQTPPPYPIAHYSPLPSPVTPESQRHRRSVSAPHHPAPPHPQYEEEQEEEEYILVSSDQPVPALSNTPTTSTATTATSIATPIDDRLSLRSIFRTSLASISLSTSARTTATGTGTAPSVLSLASFSSCTSSCDESDGEDIHRERDRAREKEKGKDRESGFFVNRLKSVSVTGLGSGTVSGAESGFGPGSGSGIFSGSGPGTGSLNGTLTGRRRPISERAIPIPSSPHQRSQQQPQYSYSQTHIANSNSRYPYAYPQPLQPQHQPPTPHPDPSTSTPSRSERMFFNPSQYQFLTPLKSSASHPSAASSPNLIELDTPSSLGSSARSRRGSTYSRKTGLLSLEAMMPRPKQKRLIVKGIQADDEGGVRGLGRWAEVGVFFILFLDLICDFVCPWTLG
ncbi:hypothetical protein M422DRAFT_45591 [Sphaerobolus stellatus SS14]|uniref:Uncharacterized protein n=1 Tax=Sphaerobolus stellatus (strain SS14) TaxID=990650 RepID=A0A0C9VVW9_SPHS4|nr:hypothetical protein M422DRAFT_45591 [Sphaerobolus stellatus SS14]